VDFRPTAILWFIVAAPFLTVAVLATGSLWDYVFSLAPISFLLSAFLSHRCRDLGGVPVGKRAANPFNYYQRLRSA
jgi:hypothetical protein